MIPRRPLTVNEVELEQRRANLAERIRRLPVGSSARRVLEARQAEICRALLMLEVRPSRSAPAARLPAPIATARAEEEPEPKLEWWQKW